MVHLLNLSVFSQSLKHMAKKKKYTIRKFINDVHLWLGLGSGIILFLVCLSGTFLTFEEEIKDLFAKELEVTPGTSKMTLAEISDSLSAEGTVVGITVPTKAAEPYEVRVKTSPKERRGTIYYTNPYTGEYQKTQASSLDGFFMFMFRLHRWLLLDSAIGRPIVGVATIFFLFISITGVVLWFPKKMKWKNFKPGFKVKFSANWKRINHDLHNTLGFYACIFLVLMTITGLCWSFEWYREGLSDVLGAQVFGNRGGGEPVEPVEVDTLNIKSMDAILDLAKAEFDYDGKIMISTSPEPTGPYSIRMYKEGAFSPVIADNLTIAADGQVLKKEIFRDKPANEQFASLIKPFHTGQVYGTFSKIIYFFACLIATSLPITDTIIWLNKMKKKNKKKRVA